MKKRNSFSIILFSALFLLIILLPLVPYNTIYYTYHLHFVSFEDCLVSVTLLMLVLKHIFKNGERILQNDQKYVLVKNNFKQNKQERGIAD